MFVETGLWGAMSAINKLFSLDEYNDTQSSRGWILRTRGALLPFYLGWIRERLIWRWNCRVFLAKTKCRCTHLPAPWIECATFPGRIKKRGWWNGIKPLTWTKIPEGQSVKKNQFDILIRTKDITIEKTDSAIRKAQGKNNIHGKSCTASAEGFTTMSIFLNSEPINQGFCQNFKKNLAPLIVTNSARYLHIRLWIFERFLILVVPTVNCSILVLIS
jgi:hypothetical protein